MGRVVWKENRVVSIGLKDGYRVLALMLKSPYLAFFSVFSNKEFGKLQLANDDVLFCGSVTRQFLKFSDVRAEPHVTPPRSLDLPMEWIDSHSGTREVVVWPGTPRERRFVSLSARSGGVLVRKDMTAKGLSGGAKRIRDVELSEYESIKHLETNFIWTYPQLNERLHLCRVLGRKVNPNLELLFEQPLPEEYATWVDIIASHGSREDWGYAD